MAQPNQNTLCDDCGEPRSSHSQSPPHKSPSPKCYGFYHFVSSELIGDAQIARGLCADVSKPDESDVCPHGVGYDDECEKCEDEE